MIRSTSTTTFWMSRMSARLDRWIVVIIVNMWAMPSGFMKTIHSRSSSVSGRTKRDTCRGTLTAVSTCEVFSPCCSPPKCRKISISLIQARKGAQSCDNACLYDLTLTTGRFIHCRVADCQEGIQVLNTNIRRQPGTYQD